MVVLATHEWTPERTDAAAAAPVAVLVHGVAGWWRTWWRVGPALAERGWRVVAVDQRGHGHSPRFEGPASVADFAADLAVVIERVGSPVNALIGHSLGAAVAAELAFARPELVRCLVLEDPPAIVRADDMAWLANLERELLAADADFGGEMTRVLEANPSWLEEDGRQEIEARRLVDRDGLMASMRRPTGARVLDIAPRLTVPALYLLAAEDRSAFPADARRHLEATLPDDSRIRVLDAGHTTHRDRFDAYLEAVLDWLEPTTDR